MESEQIIPIPQTKIIKSADHSDFMLKRLEKFYVNEELCDVTLIAARDDTQVRVHRGALAVASEFFLQMFYANFNESKFKKIKLQDINGVVLRLIVDFVYTASIELSTELVHEIVKAAHLYQIDSLVNVCRVFMEEQLTPGNCISFYTLAEQYGWTKLQIKAINVITENFSSVTNDTEFLQLNQDQLCKLIDSDELNVQSEEDVFHSIVKWLKHDEISRTESMLPLLKNVRFSELSMKFISDNRRSVCKTDECNELVWNWMEWHLSSEKRSEVEALNTKSRISRYMQTLFALSWDGSDLYTFGRPSNSFSKTKLPESLRYYEEASDFASIIATNKLFITGGSQREKAMQRVICLDLKTYEISVLPPMVKKRYSHSLLFLNGALYALGGRDETNWLDSIEKYDISNQTWQVIGSIRFSGCSQAAVLNNEIYIIGSRNMYSYNPTTGVMSAKSSKRYNTNNFVFCAVKGFLYAVGYSDHQINERYDPSADSWFSMASSPVNNDNIKCFSYKNRLCVLGCDDNRTIISTEEYYPETDEWKTSAIVPLIGSHSFALVQATE